MRLLTILVLTSLLTGCLRYYPTRSSEIEEYTDSKSTGNYVLDEDAFYSVEKENQRALEELIEERREKLASMGEEDYHIGADDELEINVFDVPELNTTVRVRPSGYITLPLVGAVKALGQTEEELQSTLTSRLRTFVRNPQVRIFVTEYAANSVYLMGLVTQPGKVPLRRDSSSLLSVLSEVGLATDSAIGPIVLIPNPNPNKETRSSYLPPNATNKGIFIYYDQLVGSSGEIPIDVPLFPGDMVIVREPATVVVDGEVENIGPYQPVGGATLVRAIASAGGITYSADVNNVEIIRRLPDARRALVSVDLEKIMLETGEDIRLRDGDIVRVPSASGRFVTRQVVDSLNRVVGFNVGGQYRVGP